MFAESKLVGIVGRSIESSDECSSPAEHHSVRRRRCCFC